MDVLGTPQSPFSRERYAVLGKLAASTAHDLNNLLTIIQIHAANIEDASTSKTDGMESARQIGLVCRRGADLMRRILLFSSGRDDVFEEIDLDPVLADVVALVEPFMRASRKLELRVAGDVGIRIYGNAGGLAQIFLNLLINAAEAPRPGGAVTISCNRVLAATAKLPGASDAVCVRVTDEGGGIPPEILDRVCEAGFTTKPDGSGMGLAIVNDWVSKHHGRIAIQSHEGSGTEICVYFPLSGPPNAVPETALPGAECDLPPLMLVVEDDPLIRRLGAQILIRADFRVIEAGTAEEALSIWDKHRDEIALLFTDIVLGGDMGGTQLARRLREDRPELKLIFTSGYYSPDRLEEPASSTNFLAKPYHPHKLIEMAKQACGKDRRVAPDRGRTAPQ